MRHKLGARGYAQAVVAAVIEMAAREGWQSDARFAEAFVRSRSGRGRGPVRIQAELRERGIDDATVEAALDINAAHWSDSALAVRERRFGGGASFGGDASFDGDASFGGDAEGDDSLAGDTLSSEERARQNRFLVQRGFTAAQVRYALNGGCRHR